MEQLKLIPDLSNADYHAKHPTETHHFSSSQLKDAKESGMIFYEKQIKSTEREEVPAGLQTAYDTGTYYHTAILEPHLLDEECIVYPKKTRAGADWKAFKELHSDKAILSQGDHKKAVNLIEGTNDNALSKLVYSGGEAETSLFVTYLVTEDTVYFVTGKKTYKLTLGGWASLPKGFEPKDAIEVRVKVRCDYRRENMGYIADLKSTSGDPSDATAVQDKIQKFGYLYSAVLYMDAFNAELLNRGKKAVYTDFIWTFATKDYPKAENYFLTVNQAKQGRAQVIKSLINVAEGLRTNWSFASKPRARVIPENVWEFRKWCPNETMITDVDELQSPVMKMLLHCVAEEEAETVDEATGEISEEEKEALDFDNEEEDDGLDCL